MSVWARIRALFGVKLEAALDRAEVPEQSLESAYRKQLAAVEQARRGVADVLTAEKRLEIEARALLGNADRYAQAAAVSAAARDDDAARRALVREAFATAQRERVLEQAAAIKLQRVALEALVERLRMRTELFRTEKLALGARLTTARATRQAGETLTGLSSGTAEVEAMVERAREQTASAQARAEALVQLAGDEVSSTESALDARIEAKLATLRALGAPPPT